MIKCRSRDVLIISKIFGVPFVILGLLGFFYFKMTLAFYIYLIVGLILVGFKYMVTSTPDSFCQTLTWFGISVYKKNFPFTDYKCIELNVESTTDAGLHDRSKRSIKIFAIYLVPKIIYNPKPRLLVHCLKGEAVFKEKNIPKIKEKVQNMSEISGLPICYSEQYKAEMKTLNKRLTSPSN